MYTIHDRGRRIIIPDFEQRTWYSRSRAISVDMLDLLMPWNCEKYIFAFGWRRRS